MTERALSGYSRAPVCRDLDAEARNDVNSDNTSKQRLVGRSDFPLLEDSFYPRASSYAIMPARVHDDKYRRLRKLEVLTRDR